MDETVDFRGDLAQVTRLALTSRPDDLRLFVARLVRKYRGAEPDFAAELDRLLRARPEPRGNPLRKDLGRSGTDSAPPMDDESRLALLKVITNPPDKPPLLPPRLMEILEQLIRERHEAERLSEAGLTPTRSAIFVGQPGVGKSYTARWLAGRLGLPLFVLDLTAVMSSLLGKTGSNLRAALDYAKSTPCVLLLDEFDAVAKRRSDDADIGELKRLVTVMLQEVDEWPASGLLIAATNHPELIDHALWRRFDLTVAFELPGEEGTKEAIHRYLGNQFPAFERWSDLMAVAFEGASYSDIERELNRFRRAIALGTASDIELIEELMKARATGLDRSSRIGLATKLARETTLSHHAISALTKVSRDTIRKYSPSTRAERGAKS